ncbi:MAG: class I SAM-dependent methyltransferase [Candidatus Thorarchaeota archaeon]|jgi:ubiquinone/menaquinone biosynthesis C-methylase UbiE
MSIIGKYLDMGNITNDSIRDVYASTARRYEMILRIYKILGVNLKKWREDAFAGLPDLKSPRILDVAVGTGANLPYLVEKYPDYKEIVGIDYTPQMLRRARKRIADSNYRDVFICQMDAKEMSVEISGKFDLILSTYSLSIIPDSPKVLAEIKKLLGPNGYLLLLGCQKFTGPLKIFNPLAIRLSTLLGGNEETYSVRVSDIASKMFQPVRRKLLYSGMFYEDLYSQKS